MKRLISLVTLWTVFLINTSFADVSNNLLLSLEFDEGMGTIARDSSAYKNDATLKDCQWVEGIYGNAINIPSVTSNIKIPNYGDFDFGNDKDFTIDFYLKIDPVCSKVYHFLFTNKNHYGAEFPGFNIGLTDVFRMVVEFSDGTNKATLVSKNSNLNDGIWHHIVLKVNRSSNATLSIDNGEPSTADISKVGSIDSIDNPLKFVGNGRDTTTCNISIDALKIIKGLAPLPPNSPEVVNVERINGTEKVKVRWSPPEPISGVELSGYKILRASDPGFSNDLMVQSVGLVTEFTDPDVDPYTVFYYKVVAISISGAESFPSKAVSVPKMGKVEGVLIENDGQGELSFVEGASVKINGLYLQETSDAEGKFVIGPLLAGDYELEIRKKSYRKCTIHFSIVAGETEFLEAIVMEIKTEPPNQVTIITVDADSYIGALLISWDPPSPKDDEEAVAYNIYRSTDPEFVTSEETILISHKEGTSHRDIDLVFGEKYYYAIKALDDADNESVLPSPIKGTKVKTPPVPNIIAPSSGEIFIDGEIPVFKWGKEDVDGYIIELCSEEKFSNNIVEIGRATGEDSSFSTEGFPTGVNYWRMRVFYDTGVVGPATEPRKIIFATTNTSLDVLSYVQFEPKIFNPKEAQSANIQFVLDKEAIVTIKVYNIAGMLLDVIITTEPFLPGVHAVEWLGKNIRGEYYKNGIYLTEIVAKDPSSGKTNRYVGRIVINK